MLIPRNTDISLKEQLKGRVDGPTTFSLDRERSFKGVIKVVDTFEHIWLRTPACKCLRRGILRRYSDSTNPRVINSSAPFITAKELLSFRPSLSKPK